MQVKSVSQLSSVISGDTGSFGSELEKMSSNPTYIEVSIRRAAADESADGEYDSFKCDFKGFINWIRDAINGISSSSQDSISWLSGRIGDLSSAIDNNFVHKTITGDYSCWETQTEIIQGPKRIENIAIDDGMFTRLTGTNLGATSINATSLTATSLTAKSINATSANVENLSAERIAELTARSALWS